MLCAEQNRLITETGPLTPCGALMRRYWQPAALVEELAEPRPVKRVRLLGEDLVLFRDPAGRYGLLHRHCAHRGADLAFARWEDGGLRCPFHGWLYDSTGACLQQPTEPAGSNVPSQGAAAGVSLRGARRHRLGVYGRRRTAGVSRLRLLHGARQSQLRLQGPVVVQLAAGAGGRHRSGTCQPPASVLPGRRHGRRGIRPPVPCRDHRRGHSDDPADARSPQSATWTMPKRPTACASPRCGRSTMPSRTSASPTCCSRTLSSSR